MDWISDQEALNTKKKELIKILIQVLGSDTFNSSSIPEEIFSSFIKITPPEVEPTHIRFITLKNRIENGARSIKPGNLILNWKNLFDNLPNIVFTGVAAINLEILIPFAALNLWNIVWSNLKIEISINHAISLYVMWINRDRFNKISEEKAFKVANQYLKENTFSELTKKEFIGIVDELCNMACIELNEGNIWLRESVKTKYQ